MSNSVKASDVPDATPSRRSIVGLNAANFFLAEVTGVIMPFLAKFLAERNWQPGPIGAASALAGLGVFLMQTPAGFIVDRVRQRGWLLAGTSLLVGVCFGLLPLVPTAWTTIGPLLFIGGAAQAFFAPLLGALALGLVGHASLSRTVGVNQGWNHVGNIAAALSAMVLATAFGIDAIFYTVLVVSLFAATSILLVRDDEVDERRATGAGHDTASASFWDLMRDPRVTVLFIVTALFHLANAPVMPLVGLYIARLGGSNTQVAAVVLVAQAVMVPVSLAAGWLCERGGRKPVFAVALVALPVRIFLYALTDDPWLLVALQTLDGIGAGIYGVVIVAFAADLTQGKGRFNALQGVLATALSAGGVVGPLLAGYLAEWLGFAGAFEVFAAIAAVSAVIFLAFMPETASPGSRSDVDVNAAPAAAVGEPTQET